MTQYDDTNRGALFRNNKKQSENQPDYTGNINVDGVEKRLAAWVKESKSGMKYFSISVSDPLPPREESAPKSSKWEDRELDDEIPF